MPNARRKERLLKRRPQPTPAAPGTGKPKAAKAPKGAKAGAAKVEMVFPAEFGTGGDEKYKSYDNDSCIGQKAPSLATLDYCELDFPKPTDGKAYIILFWAQYHKPGYEFIKRYSMLAEQYRNQIDFVAAFTDPGKEVGQKFIDDPAGKYSSVFPLKMATAHDVKHQLKNVYVDLTLKVLSVPHAFLVSKEGKIIWHQDHSELGATVPQWMNLFEQQLVSFLATGKAVKVGDKAESESEEESEDDGEGGGVEVDLDDLF